MKILKIFPISTLYKIKGFKYYRIFIYFDILIFLLPFGTFILIFLIFIISKIK
jgi:hypothetical protein